MSSTVLLTCPKCGKKLGIPARPGTIHVTCPACRTEWDWPKPLAPKLAAFAKRANAWAATALLEKAGEWIQGCWRVVAGRPRFSYGLTAVILAAGMALGFYAGYRWPARRAGQAPPDAVATNLSVEMPSVAPPGTNAGNLGDYTPQLEELLPSNGPPAKKRLQGTNH